MASKKKVESKRKFGFNEALYALVFIFEVILVFTLFDYLAHSGISYYSSVPPEYFTNKIIYGTIIGFITYIFVRDKSPIQKTLIFSATITILLEIKYTLQGYSAEFLLTSVIIHFIILCIASYIGFKITKF